MVEIKVIGSPDLDFPAFVRLQQDAFAEIIAQTGTSTLFTEAYYRWKYGAPSGPAKIALVLDHGVPIAANSMYPLRLRAGQTTVQGWQSCDTATHPSARGKGYFMKCLAGLQESLPAESIFFGFPNKNSMTGFLKIGWRHHSDVRMKARILPGRRTAGFRQIEKLDAFGRREAEFSGELCGRTGTQVDRDPSYLNWRYLQHPIHRYESFVWTNATGVRGLIVLRVVEVQGRRLAVALELLALEARVQRDLLRFAAAWAREKEVSTAVVMNTTTGPWAAFASGYCPIPMWTLPKRQVLMGAAAGPTAERLWGGPWNVQIGDWDGF